VNVCCRCVAAGVICAAPVLNDWCRAQVVQPYADSDEYDLKLVDYGGYVHLPGSSLRQIRYVYFSSCCSTLLLFLLNAFPNCRPLSLEINSHLCSSCKLQVGERIVTV